MTANKMPEAALLTHRGTEGWTREQVEADRRACYLAGIAAARECVPGRAIGSSERTDSASRDAWNACCDQVLTNLTALEQEAK